MRWLVEGLNGEKIALRLGISPKTVSVHRKDIRTKLGLHSDRDILAYVRGWGIRNLNHRAAWTPEDE